MVTAKRRSVDERRSFVIINQKGIDPPSLDLLARERGAGAFEVAAKQHLINEVKKTVQWRAQLGVEAFANALLVVPKTLAENAGLDTLDVIISLTIFGLQWHIHCIL